MVPVNGDDGAFSSAKLREFVQGRVKSNEDLYPHTGLVGSDAPAGELLSFLEALGLEAELGTTAGETFVGRTLRRSAATRHVGRSVGDVPSFAVGITDRDVEIGAAQAVGKMVSSLVNEGAAYIGTMFGAPKAGKTALAALQLELYLEVAPMKYGLTDGDEGPVVLTNMRTLRPSVETYYVTSMDELNRLVFGDVEYQESDGERGTPPELDEARPKWWHFDECSTHLDARVFRHEVATQYTPKLKRFGKVRMDSIHIGHSGYDIHPELRRETISTEFIFKTSRKTAEVFERMHEHRGSELKYELQDIPMSKVPYDPNDFSPWEWSE